MNIKDNTTTTFVSCESSMNTIEGYNKHMKRSKIENLNCRYEERQNFDEAFEQRQS